MGYRLLGLGELVGSMGKNTAFGWPSSCDDDFVEFTTVPGNFTAKEITDLHRYAGLDVL